jgi:signal transduction histidine kinase
LLYGERHDPFAVVRRLGQRLDTASGPAEALTQLTDDVRASLRLPYLAVNPSGGGLGAVSSGQAVPATTEELPVSVLGQPVATLVVGLRRGTSRLTSTERSVLHDVARRAGALVQAAALLDDVQRSRERIVIAREEERRRLRRDLHDGVGPQLAGMALQLDSLMARLNSDPVLHERAKGLRDQMRNTVADVRRVVDDLRPPALDELGLVSALRQQVTLFQPDGSAGGAGQPQLSVVVLSELPELPAAVEVAAYRIASEAIANAVRHSRCNHCTVTVRGGGEHLVVEICDDGVGIDQDVVPHVGLLSMRERAEELGGRLSIDSSPHRTTVLARLPLQESR